MRGQLFENLVVMELFKARLNQGLSPNMYFYRDQQGHEVEVVYKKGAQLISVEIKSSQTFSKHFLKQIDYFKRLFPTQIEKSYLIYGGDLVQSVGETALLNFMDSAQVLT